MLAKNKVKRRPAKKAVMKKPARAKNPTRKEEEEGDYQPYSPAGGGSNFEKSTWNGSDQSYSPEEDPEQVDEVGDKVLYSKREILEDLKINAPRQRPMRLFVQHLERQDIKPQLTKEAGKMIVKYWWNPEAL